MCQSSAQTKTLTPIHESHIGVQGWLRRATEAVYWPGMNSEVTDFIQIRDSCLSFQTSQSKEPVICHEIPTRSWKKVATDMFKLDGKSCLCTVYYYPGYFEMDELHSKTGKVIIKKLKKHFAGHGIPNELQSDNGPPFNSAEFEHFLRSALTEHITSSLGYPQSNG